MSELATSDKLTILNEAVRIAVGQPSKLSEIYREMRDLILEPVSCKSVCPLGLSRKKE